MRFYKLIATGFGVGYSKFAPGTFGALLALAIWLGYAIPLHSYPAFYGFVNITNIITLALIVVFGILGIISTNKVEKIWGKDPSKVVVDEMVGVWIPLLFSVTNMWYTYIFAFLLFRFFDIYKPLGIRKLEKLDGGYGVMMDDVLAGVYSAVFVVLVRWLVPIAS